MNMLTHEHKRVKFARVLVEIDISKPKLLELDIVLPIGKVKVNFEYEHDLNHVSIAVNLVMSKKIVLN